MSVRFLAGIILGAAAGYAAARYMDMSDEEKEKLKQKLKDRANAFKTEAEGAANKAREYITKAEASVNDLFKKKPAV